MVDKSKLKKDKYATGTKLATNELSEASSEENEHVSDLPGWCAA